MHVFANNIFIYLLEPRTFKCPAVREVKKLTTNIFLLQSNKPIMEKRRRARINNCLNELKALILDAMKKDVSYGILKHLMAPQILLKNAKIRFHNDHINAAINEKFIYKVVIFILNNLTKYTINKICILWFLGGISL